MNNRGKEPVIPRGKATEIMRCMGPCNRPKVWPTAFASDGKGGHRKICKKCWGFLYDGRNKLRAHHQKQNAIMADQFEKLSDQHTEDLMNMVKKLRNIKEVNE